MTEQNCMGMLKEKFAEEKNVCVGLDTEHAKIPDCVLPIYDRKVGIGPRMRMFNRDIIKATRDIACMYKYNLGFYLSEGMQGIWALEFSVKDARDIAPDVPIMLDAKFGDVGVSLAKYAEFAFDRFGFDAVTVNPFGGRADGMDAVLKYRDKGVFVWCRSSNEGACDFQNREKLSFTVARKVYKEWNEFGNCGLIVGARYPDELHRVRMWVQDLPILIPGIGAQGGDLAAVVKAAVHIDPSTGTKSLPAIFNSSRGTIYASNGENFAEAARKKTEELNEQILNILNPPSPPTGGLGEAKEAKA